MNYTYACDEPENPDAIQYHLDGDCGCRIALEAAMLRAEAARHWPLARAHRSALEWIRG